MHAKLKHCYFIFFFSAQIVKETCPINQIHDYFPKLAALNLLFVNLYFPFRMQGEHKIHQMKGNQFPFGVFSGDEAQFKKIFIKKRYLFRTEEEFDDLMIKITKLKTVSHKNTINLRWTEQGNTSIDLVYQYVPHSLEESFAQNPSQTVKDIHRQFIELAIYLAKYCILTAFNPSRCGAVITEQKTVMKYYLPLNEITITNDRNMLQRSVHLFNVQSMHYLDTMVTQCLNSTINESCSQRTFKNRAKLYPSLNHKDRRDSQPQGTYQSCARKLTNRPNKESQFRKLSTLSRELSKITENHKRRGASTRVSGQSFNTFQSILSLRGKMEANTEKNIKNTLKSNELTLKRCLSDNIIAPDGKINTLIERSRKALDSLQTLRQKMSTYKGFVKTIIKLKKQE